MAVKSNPADDFHFADTRDHIDDHESRFPHSAYPAPHGWERREHGGWVGLRHCDVRLPPQGWKIHISGTIDTSSRIVETVWNYCTENRIAFKFLRSAKLFHLANAKHAPRSSSGKLATLYSTGDDELLRALDELSDLLEGVQGPYILSDLRWGSGPLYLRYGGFARNYCFSVDGEYVPALHDPGGALVPETRGTTFSVPEWVKVPPFLDVAFQAREAASPPFPYSIHKALHFSNAGGVYRAMEKRSGKIVILREARPYAGLDAHGADAVTRLNREYAALRDLADLACVPQVLAREQLWEHHFLVEEFIEGDTLHEQMFRRHPYLQGMDPGPAELAVYAQWAESVLDKVEEAVSSIHHRGYVFADLSPSNIIVRPDRSVCLVDFEAAFRVEDDLPASLGTPGFSPPWHTSGFGIDMYALACLRLAVLCPLTTLMHLDGGKAEELVCWAEESFPLPRDYASRLRQDLVPSEHGRRMPLAAWPSVESTDDWGVILHDLSAAIRCSATPARMDRLFPGHMRQFEEQAACLAHGAAGVLHALHVTGQDDYPEHEEHVDWFRSSAKRMRWPRPGLYDGLAGTAYVLDELGHREESEEILDRMRGSDLRNCGIGLYGGLSGIGMTYLHFANLEHAAQLGDRLARRLTSGSISSLSPTAGLMDGWSGPALFFTSLYAKTGDEQYLKYAERAITEDISRCDSSDAGNLRAKDGDLGLATLRNGNAGIGIALHEFLQYHPRDDLTEACDRIRAGLKSRLHRSADLFGGQAGLLYGLTRLGATRSDQDVQLKALRLHAVRSASHTAFAMSGTRHRSMDLASGTAGVLVAVHAALTSTGTRPTHEALPLLSAPVT